MSTKTESEQDKVELFIQRLRNLEYVIKLGEPKIVTGSDRIHTTIREYDGGRSIACRLSTCITEYEANKDNQQTKYYYARELLKAINDAFTQGIIAEGEGLARKYRDSSDKCSKLEQDIAQLSAEHLILQGKYNELETRLRQMGIDTDDIKP